MKVLKYVKAQFKLKDFKYKLMFLDEIQLNFDKTSPTVKHL